MDPNEALQRLRMAMIEWNDADSNYAEHDAGADMYEYAEALDEWLSGGGFLPDAWARG